MFKFDNVPIYSKQWKDLRRKLEREEKRTGKKLTITVSHWELLPHSPQKQYIPKGKTMVHLKDTDQYGRACTTSIFKCSSPEQLDKMIKDITVGRYTVVSGTLK